MKKGIWGKLIIVGILLLLASITSVQVWGGDDDTVVLSDFDIYETDLRDVFRSLAEIGNMNVLIDPSVKGEATVKLKHGITAKEAIEMLAQTYGYSVRWMANNRTMLIGNEKTFANFEVKETRTYQFNYANVEQIVDALKVVIPPDHIGVDKRTNQLTIKASLLEHQNITEIVSRLDQEMPQINIEARVEEVSQTATRDLGVSWNPVLKDVTVDWSTLNFSRPISTATLKALEEQNKAKLLANPNISTTDSQEGKIFIGDKYPIITSDVTDKGISYKIEYIEIGTILTVTPRINSDDVVTVVVKAEVSSIQDWKTAGNNEIPVIRTREASSVIRLREGETFVLSGLNMNKNSENKSGVPGISKIPLLGHLFSTTKTGPNEDTEIVIFLTPKIVRTKSEKVNDNQQNVEKEPATDVKAPAKNETLVDVQTENAAANPSEQLNTGVTEAKADVADVSSLTPSAEAQSTEEPAETLPDVVTVIPEDDVKVEVASETPVVKTAEQTEPVSQPQTQSSIASAYHVKYVTKTNESLAKVAQKFGIDAESISHANNLSGTIVVNAGKELIIPVPANRVYALKPKETLWRLAKRYGTTVEILMELNNLTNYTNLEIGQQIVLPVPVDQVADPRF